MEKKLLALVGPTTTGKTKFINAIWDQFPCEIIALDSFQIYSFFTILSGRYEEASERKHLYGVVDPHEELSGEQYVKKVLTLAKQINERGSFPILSGCSITYLKALLNAGISLELIGLKPFEKKIIQKKAMERITKFFKDGLLEETKKALRLGYRDTRMMQDPLYLPYVQVAEGKMSEEESKQCWVKGIINLVKYQMAFYETLPITWLDVSEQGLSQFKKVIKKHVEQNK